MPKSAFTAIENSIRALLGRAEVSLLERESDQQGPEPADRGEMLVGMHIDDTDYLFRARRRELAFTAMEEDFMGELLAAFEGLFAGFSAEGFAAHFRTALLTSLTDIAVARYIRGNRKGVFWPTQSLIQLLKSLSYQRYEGTPATTGFLVFRTHLDDFLRSLEKTRYDWLDLGDDRRRITGDFFQNPLSYRFVDGYRALFVCDIQMNLKGAIRTSAPGPRDNIDQLSNRETLALLSQAGEDAFAIYVNKASEVEVVLGTDRLLLWRKGYWGIFDPDILREFLQGKLDKRSIEHLIWSVYALSKSRHGTVVMVADDKTDLKALRMGSVGGRDPLSRALIRHVRGTKIGTLKRSGELSRILSSDGMTVINRKGEVLDTGVIIDTSRVSDLVTGGGRTTAATAASHFGPVVKVSEDGQVELFRDGRRIYRFG
ncbi:MAG: diadenylate cyclase [Desulfuromonadales bacterium]